MSSEDQFQDNAQVSSKTELTTQIVMEDIATEVNTSRLFKVDPYPSKTPTHLLQRQYLISEQTLATGETKMLFPLRLLLEVESIKEALQRFRYIRTAVKITVLFVSTTMQYGMAMVSAVPYTKSLTRWASIVQQSQAEPMLLNISQQDGCEMVLPYLSPASFQEISSVADDPTWRVSIHCLGLQTVTVGSPTKVTYQVWAELQDLETLGYQAQFTPFPPDPPEAVFQSNFRGRMAQLAGAGTAVAGAVKLGQSAFSSAKSVHKDVQEVIGMVSPSTEKVSEPEPTQLSLCPDLGSTGARWPVVKLGDNGSYSNPSMPTSPGEVDLVEIASTPTYSETVFITDKTLHFVDTDLFSIPCHASYVSQMFKYFRGNALLVLKFVASEFISSRVAVTLYPAQDPAEGTYRSTEGDLPTWILTLRGGADICIELPYLKPWPWSDPSLYVFPSVTVQLLDALPQPFDKTVGVYMFSFLKLAPDCKFSGLQSFVPQPLDEDEPEAEFQSTLRSCFIDYERQESTYPFPYQGSRFTVNDVLNRSSTREPDVPTTVPFPVRIADWTDAYKLDNFDYVSNLFCFYTGNVNLKMLYSKANASGLLRSCVGHSKRSVKGKKWKGGNSMAMTDQVIWPMMDYSFPYCSAYPFDSIWEPNPVFVQTTENIEDLSSIFVSRSPNFFVGVLLPVPDFFEPEEAEFQSAVRLPRDYSYSRVGPFSGSAVSRSIVVPDMDLNSPMTVFFTGYVRRVTGTTDGSIAIAVDTVNNATMSWSPTIISSAGPICGAYVPWTDHTNSGKTHSSFAVSTVSAPTTNRTIIVSVSLAPGDLNAYEVAWRLDIKTWSSHALLSNASSVALHGEVSLTPGSSIITVPSGVVPVSLDQQVYVSVENTPDVHIASPITIDTTTPLSVTVDNVGPLPTLITNTVPIDVSIIGEVDVTTTGPIPVIGSPGSDTPVWTTVYKT